MVRWGNKLQKQTAVQSFAASGAQAVDVPIGPECRGGCHVMVILTAPVQSARLNLPVPVPTSPVFGESLTACLPRDGPAHAIILLTLTLSHVQTGTRPRSQSHITPCRCRARRTC